MRKKSKLIITAIILSLLTFNQIAYCHEASIGKSKSITISYVIDPPFPDPDSKPGSK